MIFVNKGKGIETSDGEYNVVDELAKTGKNVFAVHKAPPFFLYYTPCYDIFNRNSYHL